MRNLEPPVLRVLASTIANQPDHILEATSPSDYDTLETLFLSS